MSENEQNPDPYNSIRNVIVDPRMITSGRPSVTQHATRSRYQQHDDKMIVTNDVEDYVQMCYQQAPPSLYNSLQPDARSQA